MYGDDQLGKKNKMSKHVIMFANSTFFLQIISQTGKNIKTSSNSIPFDHVVAPETIRFGNKLKVST